MSDLVSLSKISLIQGTFTQVLTTSFASHLISYPDPVRTAHPNATKVERMRSGRARNIERQSRADQIRSQHTEATAGERDHLCSSGVSTGIERKHRKQGIYA